MIVAIRDMLPADSSAVARLHAETITEGFLSKLGPRFLRQLYLGVAADEGSRVWVAESAGRIVGFLAYSRDVGKMYRRVLRGRWFCLALASVPSSLNPLLLKEVADTLRYPAKQATRALPPAEILSVGVAAAARGAAVGRKLVETALDQARRDGQSKLKVLAGAKLLGANRFYLSCAFERAAVIQQHGDTLNVYVRSVSAG